MIRKQIENRINQLGYELGCYDTTLDNILTKKALNQVLSRLEEEYTDVFIRIRRKLYIVCISTVDSEKDVVIYPSEQYFSLFGNLEEHLDLGDITQSEYDKIAPKVYRIW